MNSFISKLKKLGLFALAFIPSPLPIGMTEFDVWAKSVLSLTKLPDNDSTRFTLASMIPHQKVDRFYISKITFANMINKAAANQIGGAVMQELKAKQLVAIEAAKQAEATALNGAPSGING